MDNPARDSTTAKEALIAELLGELDAVIKRVEVLPGEILGASRSFAEARVALEAASGKFRAAVRDYTDHAKLDFSRQLKLEAEDVGSRMLSQQRSVIQTAAREAFELSATEAATNLAATIDAATKRIERAGGTNWLLVSAVATTSAMVSAFLTAVALRFFSI
jgi:ribosome-associated translation inhibitor RaiA